MASLLGTTASGGGAGYVETDLVVNKSVNNVPTLTDKNGIVHIAKFFDPNLVNPWGVGESTGSPFWVSDNGGSVATLAQASFGEFGGDLLIGNFRNGHINAFDPATGEFLGKVRDAHGQAIVIDGLWSLPFGNGGSGGDPRILYFTAGPNGESDGLFGSLSPE